MNLKDKFKVVLNGIIIPIIIYIFITVLASAIISLILYGQKLNLMFIQGGVNICLIVALIPLYINFKNKYNLKNNEFNFKYIVYIISIAISMCMLLNILIAFIPREEENVVSKSIMELNDEYNIYLTLFIVSIIVPITEELFFRGFIFDSIKLISNNIIAILVSSVFFGIVHSDFQQILYAFIVGIMLSYLKSKFNNLIYPIIMHSIMNMTSLFLLKDISMFNDIKTILYTLFISTCILVFSIIRININNL